VTALDLVGITDHRLDETEFPFDRVNVEFMLEAA